MISALVAVAVGLAATAVTFAYWDRIKNWLNTVVADRLEKVFGYGARKRLHHAVSIADRTVNGIRTKALKENEPELYQKYVKSSTSRRFTLR